MIYLLEGPDGTGKTTLAKEIMDKSISSKNICLYFHYSNKTLESGEENYWKILRNLKKWKKRGYDIVLDRAWISNIVYECVYNKARNIKVKSNSWLEKELLKVIDKVIVCLPKDKEKYMAQFNELLEKREEAYAENMDHVYDLFNGYAEKFTRYDLFDYSMCSKPSLKWTKALNDLLHI